MIDERTLDIWLWKFAFGAICSVQTEFGTSKSTYLRPLPVFGVGARDDHFNQNLVCIWLRNGGLNDRDLWAWSALASHKNNYTS